LKQNHQTLKLLDLIREPKANLEERERGRPEHPPPLISDRGRIYSSTGFRRLQSKAQVFSLEENAAVRSRLTHSLEVSSIAKRLARIALKPLQTDSGKAETICELAALIHDIGNPPFGHFGESVIQNWVKTKLSKKAWWENIPKEFQHDFKSFDGNAQGLRIVSRLQWHNGPTGLHLTYPVMATMIKYPRSQPDGDEKKIGHFQTEEDLIRDIWTTLGIPEGARHPLSYILEAADDIAYAISDIEDAIEKGIFRPHEIKDSITARITSKSHPEKGSAIEFVNNHFDLARPYPYVSFKIELLRQLTGTAGGKFSKQYDSGLDFNKVTIWDENCPFNLIRLCMRDFAREDLFQCSDAVQVELHGKAVLERILLELEAIMDLDRTVFQKLRERKVWNKHFRESRINTMLPKKARRVYEWSLDNKVPERVARLHFCIDYIAGLTDPHALKTSKVLAGIELERK